MSIPVELKDFDIVPALDEIERIGAVSVPILPDQLRLEILEEIKDSYRAGLHYRGIVWEHSSAYTATLPVGYRFPAETRLGLTLATFSEFMGQKAEEVSPYPFEFPLKLEDRAEILKYNAGSEGIKQHTDMGDNLRAIFIIEGEGEFYVCNHQGENRTQIPTTPGNVILMRAPGFRGTKREQYHLVRGIKSTRYIVAIGQVVPEYYAGG